MARIRTIKPEFWDDEKLSKVSRDARLTFIGLWTHSDDYGVVRGNHVWLKHKIFPYDGISPETFRTWLDELAAFGFILPFDANGESYYLIRNFKKHQRINRESKCARNPAPPEDLNDHSSPIHRALNESSMSTHGALSEHSLQEGKGIGEGKGIKTSTLSSKGTDDPPPEPIPASPPSAPLSLARPPTKQEIEISALPKVEEDIYALCERLHEERVFVKAHAFANAMLKRKKNPRAVLHALTRCLVKAQAEPFTDQQSAPWAYCSKILGIENGNFNEIDHRKDPRAANR
ncbi:MAG: hypothetical protein WHT06_14635 [Desulfobacterales bacterium]